MLAGLRALAGLLALAGLRAQPQSVTAHAYRRMVVTHFVDDRLYVLNHLTSVDHRILFTGGLGVHPSSDPRDVPADITMLPTWPATTRWILDNLKRYGPR